MCVWWEAGWEGPFVKDGEWGLICFGRLISTAESRMSLIWGAGPGPTPSPCQGWELGAGSCRLQGAFPLVLKWLEGMLHIQ